jgi:abortive infection Abi-like protein
MATITMDDLFTTADVSGWASSTTRTFRLNFVQALRLAPSDDVSDLDAAVALAELLQTEFMAYGTGGGEQLDDRSVGTAVRTLRAVLTRLGVSWRPSWQSFTDFRTYWLDHEGYGSWQARRSMVSDEYGTMLRTLYARQDGPTEETVVAVALDALPDATAIHDHLRRLGPSVDADPRLAVSVAKDLVESTAKLVLRERAVSYTRSDSLPALVERSQTTLRLSASGVEGSSEEAKALRTLLGSLTRLTQGVTELRNQVGVGHGRESVPEWVRPRHARLAASAAAAWCNLMLETLADPDAPWRSGAEAR